VPFSPKEPICYLWTTLLKADTVGLPNVNQTFSRHWAKIAITTSTHQWYASRLLIGTHGKRVEIGRDLVEQERIALAKALTQVLPLHQGLII